MRSLVPALLLTVVACPLVVSAEAPRYRWQADRQFVFDVEISADLPDKTESLKGRIIYRVKSADEPLKIGYRGGLTKSVRTKPGAASSPRPPFGPRFIPPPMFHGPFARQTVTFAGLIQTTNEITMTSSGEILVLKGSSQLPYLLGNLSLLVFEPLPDKDEKSWEADAGVLIRHKGETSGGFNPFRDDPFFARHFGSNKPEKMTTGGGTTSFALQKKDGESLAFKKTYHMHSPGDEASLTIDGTGTWTFNRHDGMSESLDFKQELLIEEKNVSLKVPVSIKYRRLSDEEWAKIEQERIAAETARREEAERKAAEAKALADAPVEGKERKQILASLALTSGPELEAALKTLAGKSPRSDDELAQAIKPHVDQADASLQELAKKALAAFSPDDKRSYDLNASYRGSKAVSELGLWINYDTPLPTGLIIAANRFGRGESTYFPATVQATMSNGMVKVKFNGHGSRAEERLREDLFLAPAEVEQPNLDESQLAEVRAYCEAVMGSLGDSPEQIEQLDKLNRAYRDSNTPLPKTGPPVPEKVSLPKYLVVAAPKKDGQWYQAHIQEELSDGRVAVRFPGDHWDAKFPRASLRLPPAEVKPINLPPLLPENGDAAVRTWTDDSGTFTLEAKFLGEDGTNVRLLPTDGGGELTVPLERLSESDRNYVESLRKPEVTNPFARH